MTKATCNRATPSKPWIVSLIRWNCFPILSFWLTLRKSTMWRSSNWPASLLPLRQSSTMTSSSSRVFLIQVHEELCPQHRTSLGIKRTQTFYVGLGMPSANGSTRYWKTRTFSYNLGSKRLGTFLLNSSQQANDSVLISDHQFVQVACGSKKMGPWGRLNVSNSREKQRWKIQVEWVGKRTLYQFRSWVL